jgi:hypothetical protein
MAASVSEVSTKTRRPLALSPLAFAKALIENFNPFTAAI